MPAKKVMSRKVTIKEPVKEVVEEQVKEVIVNEPIEETVKVEKVVSEKPVKRKTDPTKKIMNYIQKNLEGIDDLSKEAKVLKSLHDAYKKEPSVKKPSNRVPKFEKGSQEAKDHMAAIRAKRNGGVSKAEKDKA